MKRASELIEITNRLDYSNDYKKFYEFAKNYIMHMKVENNTETEEFFKTIKVILNNTNDTTVKNALGIESKENKVKDIERWCNFVSENEELRELELAELHYVFGYATRKAKILKPKKENNGQEKSQKSRNDKHKNTDKIKPYKSLKGKVTKYRNNVGGEVTVEGKIYKIEKDTPKEINIIVNKEVIIDLDKEDKIVNIRQHEETCNNERKV